MTNKEIRDKIVEELNIVDVVSEYVQLEKSGNSLKGLCPFHDDSTPSFHVSPEKKICKCFSCGEGGDVLSFYSKINHVSYFEATRALAKRIGVEVKKSEQEEKNEYLFSINEKTQAFYNFCLNNTVLGEKALKYLEQRKIDQKMIEDFKIGLAPKESDSLYKYLLSKEYNAIEMMDLGLIRSKEDHYFDVFNSRIIFPICNEFNKIVGFSGRIFQGEKNTGKYMNSMETVLFKKSDILYNLNNAKEFIKKKSRVIILEGFMDVIACHRADIFEVVCTMGTALTTNHAKLLKKYTDHVVLCFDGDDAGKKATIKAIQILKEHNLTISVVTLPDNLDPDEYQLKYGKEKLQDYLNLNALDEISFQYTLLRQNLNLRDLNSTELFKEKIFDLIQTNVRSVSMKDRFLGTASKDLNLDKSKILADFEQFLSRKTFQNREVTIRQEIKIEENQRFKVDKYFNSERTLLKFMIQSKINYLLIENELSGIQSTYQLLFEMREKIARHYLKNEELNEEDFKLLLDDHELDFFDLYIKNFPVNYDQNTLASSIKNFNQYNENLKKLQFREEIKKTMNPEEKIMKLEILRKSKKGGKL